MQIIHHHSISSCKSSTKVSQTMRSSSPIATCTKTIIGHTIWSNSLSVYRSGNISNSRLLYASLDTVLSLDYCGGSFLPYVVLPLQFSSILSLMRWLFPLCFLTLLSIIIIYIKLFSIITANTVLR